MKGSSWSLPHISVEDCVSFAVCVTQSREYMRHKERWKAHRAKEVQPPSCAMCVILIYLQLLLEGLFWRIVRVRQNRLQHLPVRDGPGLSLLRPLHLPLFHALFLELPTHMHRARARARCRLKERDIVIMLGTRRQSKPWV